VLVLARGLVPPAGTLPSAYVSGHVAARAVASLGGPGADGALAEGAAVVLASADAPFLAQLASVLRAAGLDVTTTAEVAAVELAGTAAGAAGPAAEERSPTTNRPRRPRAA
jgi:glycerol-3-phosphate dehydrogenase